MKVYLDMCSIQRPLDSQDDVRVATEAQAVLGVLRLCESGQVTLVGSDALLFELEKNRIRSARTTLRPFYPKRELLPRPTNASKRGLASLRRAG